MTPEKQPGGKLKQRVAAEELEEHPRVLIKEHLQELITERLVALYPHAQPDRYDKITDAFEELIREKLDRYYRKRLEEHQERIKAEIEIIAQEYKTKRARVLKERSYDELLEDEKNELDILAEQNEGAMREYYRDILNKDLDLIALRDEIAIRFPSGASIDEQKAALKKLISLEVKDLINAHAQRDYQLSHEDMQALIARDDVAHPHLVFADALGEVTEEGVSYQYVLAQLTSESQLAWEGSQGRHCIGKVGTDYTHDLTSYAPDGQLKTACFSVRKRRKGASDATEDTVVATMWYNRERRMIEQVKKPHNVLVTDPTDPEDMLILRALAQLRTRNETRAYPIERIADLHEVELGRNVLLVSNKNGVIGEVYYPEVFLNFFADITILAGEVSFDETSTEELVRTTVATRGVQVEISSIPPTSVNVFIDEVLSRQRRDLAYDYVSAARPRADTFDLYRFPELLKASMHEMWAHAMLEGVSAEKLRLIDRNNIDLMIHVISSSNNSKIAENILRRTNAEKLQVIGKENANVLAQVIVRSNAVWAANNILMDAFTIEYAAALGEKAIATLESIVIIK